MLPINVEITLVMSAFRQRNSVENFLISYCYHCLLQGIVYMVLTDKGYPKRLAFLYLDELHEEFLKVDIFDLYSVLSNCYIPPFYFYKIYTLTQFFFFFYFSFPRIWNRDTEVMAEQK